jgi:hypothetical protein
VKTLIYTTAVDSDTSKFKNSLYSQYCILSWEKWCKKNGIDFLVIRDNDPRYKFPVWNKDRIFELVGNTYEKIGYVDSDTIVRWDCPNPFDLYTDEFCGVKEISSLRWIYNSISTYGHFYPNVTLPLDEYINSGVVFFTRDHKYIYDELIELYVKNQSELDTIKGVGKVQTLLNLSLKKNHVKQKYFDDRWNLFSIHKKNMFVHNWQLNEDKTPFFVKYAYVWHFTGFPIESRTDVMKNVWESVKHLYE